MLVTVDVRGTLFRFHKPEVKRWVWLEQMLEMRPGVDPAQGQPLFIDRNPKYFQQVLDYACDNILLIPERYEDMLRLSKEFDYFGLDYSKNIWINYLDRYILKYEIENVVLAVGGYFCTKEYIRSITTNKIYYPPDNCEFVRGRDKLWLLRNPSTEEYIVTYKEVERYRTKETLITFCKLGACTSTYLINFSDGTPLKFSEHYKTVGVNVCDGKLYLVGVRKDVQQIDFLDDQLNLLKEIPCEKFKYNNHGVTSIMGPRTRYFKYNGEEIPLKFEQAFDYIQLGDLVIINNGDHKRIIDLRGTIKNEFNIFGVYLVEHMINYHRVMQPPHFE